MSHWIKVGTKMDKLDHIAQALDRMGQKYELADDKKLSVKAAGNSSEVDILIVDERNKKEIGMKQQKDGTFAFVGDFYYTGINQQQFTNKLQGNYCVAEAVDRLGSQGFFVDNEDDLELNKDGLIEFTCSNYTR